MGTLSTGSRRDKEIRNGGSGPPAALASCSSRYKGFVNLPKAQRFLKETSSYGRSQGHLYLQDTGPFLEEEMTDEDHTIEKEPF